MVKLILSRCTKVEHVHHQSLQSRIVSVKAESTDCILCCADGCRCAKDYLAIVLYCIQRCIYFVIQFLCGQLVIAEHQCSIIGNYIWCYAFTGIICGNYYIAVRLLTEEQYSGSISWFFISGEVSIEVDNYTAFQTKAYAGETEHLHIKGCLRVFKRYSNSFSTCRITGEAFKLYLIGNINIRIIVQRGSDCQTGTVKALSLVIHKLIRCGNFKFGYGQFGKLVLRYDRLFTYGAMTALGKTGAVEGGLNSFVFYYLTFLKVFTAELPGERSAVILELILGPGLCVQVLYSGSNIGKCMYIYCIRRVTFKYNLCKVSTIREGMIAYACHPNWYGYAFKVTTGFKSILRYFCYAVRYYNAFKRIPAAERTCRHFVNPSELAITSAANWSCRFYPTALKSTKTHIFYISGDGYFCESTTVHKCPITYVIHIAGYVYAFKSTATFKRIQADSCYAVRNSKLFYVYTVNKSIVSYRCNIFG